jgi:hypothetical protein
MRRMMMVVTTLALVACHAKDPAPAPVTAMPHYPIHKDITVTYFWVGEAASSDNANISNLSSAWDEHWVQHFGGVDDPRHRLGYRPLKFEPQENAFYFALPYSDSGRRAQALQIIPWAAQKDWGPNESLCKNRWIKITKADKVCYAQWEDVGPFNEHDAAYVFGDGTQRPKNKRNHHAGLDVSPAVHDYLKLGGMDRIDWQFVDDADVPDGPWKKTITTSPPH